MTALLLRLMGLCAVQRAEDAGLVRRCQPLFVPHTRTRLLEELSERPTEWADLHPVEREPARRPR